jgi:hypothetical protein
MLQDWLSEAIAFLVSGAVPLFGGMYAAMKYERGVRARIGTGPEPPYFTAQVGFVWLGATLALGAGMVFFVLK